MKKLVSFSLEKSIRYPIARNKVESAQSTSHYMQNSPLLWFFTEFILDSYPQLDGNLLGSLLLE